jgi:transposase
MPKPRRYIKNVTDLVRAARPEAAQGKPLEMWFQDEARVGQQGTLTRLWARKGTRPRAPKDCRYAWAFACSLEPVAVAGSLFGAVCPARATDAALVMPHANTEAMNAHLAEISLRVAPGAHGIRVLDGAGWHSSKSLVVPENITLSPLPPYSPELNPVENLWQYLRQNNLANRVFESYEDIVDVCCTAWNTLIASPQRLASITRREWAQVSG